MFFPDGARAGRLDQQMRAALAESLDYLHSVAGEHLGMAEADLMAMLDRIRAARMSPAVFGHYYRLVPAIERGDHVGAARLLGQLATRTAIPVQQRVVAFDPTELADAALYTALLDPGAEGPSLGAPPEEVWLQFRDSARDGLQIIAAIDAPLSDELHGLVTEVVAAMPSREPRARSFGGISSIMLWGAVTLSMDRYLALPDVLEGLVHEGAHHLLFGLSIEEPLCTNELAERYPSPLRSDPRPMDGIFHATFVSARVHYAFSRLRSHMPDAFGADSAAIIDRQLAQARQNFIDGAGVVARHGALTELGHEVMASATDYMKHA